MVTQVMRALTYYKW